MQTILTLNGHCQSNITISEGNTLTKSKIYYFAETSDSLFCNEDSIVGSDCSGGELYLTSKGNAIYIFHCCCEGKESYDIGRYIITSSGIICTFSKECNYKGAVKSTKKWEIKMSSIPCGVYLYGFEEDSIDEKSKPIKVNYVVKESGQEELDQFIKTASRFKKLSPYLN
jgi:hypothetical protein